MKTILCVMLSVLICTGFVLAVTGSFVVTEEASQQTQNQENQNQPPITGQTVSETQEKEDNFIIKFFKKLFSFFKR